MLKKADAEKIATLLKMDVKAFTDAVADKDEKDITIPDTIEVFSKEDLDKRDNNEFTRGKVEGEKVGETKGKELAAKVIKTKLGITDDTKDLEVIATKAVEKMNGDQALKDQVDLLQKDVKQKEKAIAKLQGDLTLRDEQGSIMAALPKKLSDALTVTEHADLVGRHIKKTEAGYEYDGQLLRKDGTKDPMSREEAYDWFYQQKRPALLVKEANPGGRGGNDDPGTGGVLKTLADVQKAFKKEHPEHGLLSEEFNTFLADKVKEAKGEIDFTKSIDAVAE